MAGTRGPDCHPPESGEGLLCRQVPLPASLSSRPTRHPGAEGVTVLTRWMREGGHVQGSVRTS